MAARLMILCVFAFSASMAFAAPDTTPLPTESGPVTDIGPAANEDEALRGDIPQPGTAASGPTDPNLQPGNLPGHAASDDATATDAVDPVQADDVSLNNWDREDWTLVRPQVALIELRGALRLRGDLMRRLDFDNGSNWEYLSDGLNQTALPRYLPLSDGHAQYTQTSIRLRVEPRINVSDQIQIITMFDVFENFILGTTPNTLAPGEEDVQPPTNVLSNTQISLRRGINTFNDSIAIKRVWGRVTALNDQLELRFGRMTDNWGLGMWYKNDSACLDCDYGTNVDRIALSFRVLGHVFTPLVDWISKGPQILPFGFYDPKPIDAVGWDDAMQYGLRISRETSREETQDAILHHHDVINYGLSNLVRVQSRDLPLAYYNNQSPYLPSNPPNINAATLDAVGQGERRDALIYQGDVYGKYYHENLELAAELGVMVGTFKDALLPSLSAEQQTTNVLMLGAAFESLYYFRHDHRGTRLGLKFGGASGDSRHGMGALDQQDTQRGPTATGADRTLRNFQFNPDYHLDLILFRRMIGVVTDAWYLRPEVAYRFDQKLEARVAGIYSQAIMGTSTPSASAGGPGHKPLGFELDGEIIYGADPRVERGQLLASLAGGMLFPFSGFNNPTATGGESSGHFAWTIQARLFLTF